MLGLNNSHTRKESCEIHYETVLKHVSHWTILRQRYPPVASLVLTFELNHNFRYLVKSFAYKDGNELTQKNDN